eukprot:gene17297-22834_t
MSKLGYNVPKTCVVTGGSGFVGQRLVEMLVERGSKRVVSFDIAPKPKDALDIPEIEYIKGDITNQHDVDKALKGCECVFHIAALVGPYHPKEAYKKVNYDGTINILNACEKYNIKRIVMSSSPSTRFPYPDPTVYDLTEDDLFRVNKGDYAPVFLQPYAETKALGEKAVLSKCGSKADDLLTIAVAPHQVYGPRDGLFLPNLLEVAGSNKLRIFGYEALYPNSPALGKFYIITDGPGQKFWHILDQAIVAMGFNSLFKKIFFPTYFMMFLAYLTVILGAVEEHAICIKKLGAKTKEIRLPIDFQGIDGIILPGGESTAMAIVGEEYGLFPELKKWVQSGKPIWGTCAGMILLSDHAIKQKEGGQSLVGGLDVHICRNFFGPQINSCKVDLSTSIEGMDSSKFPAVFIRAPAIIHIGSEVTKLAEMKAIPHPSAKDDG